MLKHRLATVLALVIAAGPTFAGVDILLSTGTISVVDVIPRLQSLGHNVTVSDAGSWDASFDYSPYDVVAFEFYSAGPADVDHLVAAVDSGTVGVVFLRGIGSVSGGNSVAKALGLSDDSPLNYQTPTDLELVDNLHCITQGLTLGIQNLGFTYMTAVQNPGVNTTVLAKGPASAALVVHNTRRAVIAPFYGHATGSLSETAFSESITERSIQWAAGNDGCMGSTYCTATLNSSGGAALLSATGSIRIADNDLTLRAEPVPNQVFLFLFGPDQVDVPFGNGRLCVGGNLNRINPPGVASGNIAERSLDLGALGVTPGMHNFQCWFRDLPAGGAHFNTSDAMSIQLLP